MSDRVTRSRSLLVSGIARVVGVAAVVAVGVALAGLLACGETPRGNYDGAGVVDGPLMLVDGGTHDGPQRQDVRQIDAPVRHDSTSPKHDSMSPKHDSKPLPLDGGGSLDGQPGTFTKTYNGRSYKLFVPSGYKASVAIPVILAFHGAGDSGAKFFAILNYYGMTAAAKPANYILIVPETKSPYHDFVIWSGNLNNDGPAIKKEMDDLLALVDDLSKHYRIDPRQIHAFGFSDGGAFSAIGGMSRADRLASLTVASYGWGSGYPLFTPSRKIATQFLVGTSDGFYNPAKTSSTFLQGKGHATRFLSATGVGHTMSALLAAHSPTELFTWMKQHPRP